MTRDTYWGIIPNNMKLDAIVMMPDRNAALSFIGKEIGMDKFRLIKIYSKETTRALVETHKLNEKFMQY